jgi:hypothetical protein
VVSHVVLLSPRRDLSIADREAFVAAFEEAVTTIPSIRGVRVGRRLRHGAGYEASAPDADYLAVLDFDDVAGLQAYLRHPAHGALGERFGVSLSSAWVFDFDVGGLEALRAGGFLEER